MRGPVPVTDGPTHPCIGASPGCWAIYGQVLAREYGEYAYPPVHRLTVDAYAAQHPGVPSRRSSQSVAVHLIDLHLILERGYEPERATAAIRAVLARGHDFVWLDSPAPPGAVTVLDVVEARGLAEHTESGWRSGLDLSGRRGKPTTIRFAGGRICSRAIPRQAVRPASSVSRLRLKS